MSESVLDAAEEVVGGLAVDSLAVGLAGVGQHDAKDMSFAALAVGADDRGACAEVDLGLITRPALETAERELACRLQAMDETTDAGERTPEPSARIPRLPISRCRFAAGP